MAKPDLAKLSSILKREKEDAQGVNSSELASERKLALDFYRGDMTVDMPSAMGRSKAVSTDVADVVEGLMAPLMEVFAAGEQVVEFDPVGQEDEAAAAQETDYVNHVFMQRNAGFLTLYSFVKDALLSKVGIVKVWWDVYERSERETYKNQDLMAYMGLLMKPDVTVVKVEQHEAEEGAPATAGDTSGAAGQAQQPETLYDVVLETKKGYGCAKVEPVPPEEFGISKAAKNIKDATYIYHEPTGVTESDLINQDYDRAQVEGLPDFNEKKSSEEAARDRTQGSAKSNDSAADKPMRLVRLTEHYKVLDLEDDGKPALYRITTGGESYEVLTKKGEPDIVQIDAMPFAAASPIINTHRFFGRAIADLCIDIQRIKTALLRALLDNAYLANNQRNQVAMDLAHPRTIDDMLVNRPGAVVRTKQPNCIAPILNQPIGDFAFPLIEYVDGTREWRTGVSKTGQGIDANALQNQSATAVMTAFTATQARMRLIARVLAETGLRDLFALLHATIRKNETKANTVRLRNQWVQVDPRNWKTRDDMTINVALGTGSREVQIQHLMTLLGIQKEAIMVPQLGLVKPDMIYNTLSKLVGKMHLKPDDHFNDPAKNPPPQQPQQPDPKMVEAQGKLAIKQQETQAELALDQQKSEAEHALKIEEMNREFELKQQQQNAEFALKREQLAEELNLKRQEIHLTAGVKQNVGIAHAKAKADATKVASNVRFGGELG